MNLYRIFQVLMSCTMLITCIVAFRSRNSKTLPDYMRYFYLYPVVGFIITIIATVRLYFKSISGELIHLIDNYSLLFHFGFLSFFLFQKIHKAGVFRYYKTILLSYVGLILVLLILFDSTTYNLVAFGTANTGLLAICIVYFAQLFKSTDKNMIFDEPFFWVTNGVFFGMAISIPINLTANYLYENISYGTYTTIVALMPFGYSVMYLCFIKAHLCKKH